MAPRTNGRKRKTDDLHQEEPEEATRLEAIAEDHEEAQASSQGPEANCFLQGSSSVTGGGGAICQPAAHCVTSEVVCFAGTSL